MFGCITKLKGLVIDIDSFKNIEISKWKNLLKAYKCLFLVSDEEIYKKVIDYYGKTVIYKVEKFRKLFAPNRVTHEYALNFLNLQCTEVAYVSKNITFLNNAMNFLGGTIWITDEITYEKVSKAPDLICFSFKSFEKLMKDNIKGFLGEVVIFPDENIEGMIIPVQFDVEGREVPMYMLGRYFGYSHYMSQLHPYSTAIALNKKEGKSYYRKFDQIFVKLYSCVIEKIQKTNVIDGVVAVPVRPGKDNRFGQVLEILARNCNINNYGDYFKCVQDYPKQKLLSSLERQDNVSKVFKCEEELIGKNIVIIDDIITTGATIKECVRTLWEGGVEHVFIIVLAINQLQGNYWSSDMVQVTCPKCREKMCLLVNGKNRSFFYLCYACRKTLSFEEGRELLCNDVNSENT